MLITQDGMPYPPQGMVERLHEIHSALGLRFYPGLRRWGVTFDWPQDDPRWMMVRKGEMAAVDAYDALAFLPEDCSPDEAYGYIVRSFKAFSGSRADVKQLLDRVHLYNKQAQDATKQETLDLATEMLEANAGTLFREEGKTTKKFYMSEPTSTKGRKRSKHKVIQE